MIDEHIMGYKGLNTKRINELNSGDYLLRILRNMEGEFSSKERYDLSKFIRPIEELHDKIMTENKFEDLDSEEISFLLNSTLLIQHTYFAQGLIQRNIEKNGDLVSPKLKKLYEGYIKYIDNSKNKWGIEK